MNDDKTRTLKEQQMRASINAKLIETGERERQRFVFDRIKEHFWYFLYRGLGKVANKIMKIRIEPNIGFGRLFDSDSTQIRNFHIKSFDIELGRPFILKKNNLFMKKRDPYSYFSNKKIYT